MNSAECEICSRPSSSKGLCENHSRAFTKLEIEYPRWKLAYGEIVWKKYLESVCELEGTGIWVREVAKNELAHFFKSGKKSEETLHKEAFRSWE